MRNELGNGIKEMGIPPMNRIEISKLAFTLGNDNSPLNMAFSDVIFKGAEHFQIKNVNVDLNKGIFDLAMLVPFFEVTAKYEMNGKLVLLDLESNGGMKLNFSKYSNNLFLIISDKPPFAPR